MSAFVVDRVHIDVLVALARNGVAGIAPQPGSTWYGWHYYWKGSRDQRDRTETELGRMLLAENVASVSFRYEDRKPLPGSCDVLESGTGEVSDYTYRNRGVRLTIAEAVQAIACYEYQSCEHPGWKESEAHAFCEALKAHVLRFLPGRDAAPWAWTDETLATRRAAA